MTRLAFAGLVLLACASLAAGADEAAYLEGKLQAWKGGEVPEGLRSPAPGDLLRYEIISVVITRLNDADVALVNALCTFEARRRRDDDPTKPPEMTLRAVLRLTTDAKAPDGFRLSAAWRPLIDFPTEPRPAAAAPPKPLAADQRAAATRAAVQIRNPKLDPGQRNRVRDELAAYGPAVMEIALRELRTAEMDQRRELVNLARRVHPADEAKVLREELANAVALCPRIVARIQDDAAKADDYRDRAAKCKVSTGGSYGGLKFKPETGERDSFLRLAAKFDEKVADSRRDLDACVEIIETCCNDFARYGSSDDLRMLASLAEDKLALTKAAAWSGGVVTDDEHAQLPPVGFSAHRGVSVPAQEQDWLPWGPLWGALRTLAARTSDRAALTAFRDEMEKTFVPLEKKRAVTWQQACLVTEFQRTEGIVIARLAAADGPKPAPSKAVECAGEARDLLLAALTPPVDKPGEDPMDRRRRLGRYEAARREAAFPSYHVVMKFVPPPQAVEGAPAAALKLPAEPSFTPDAFDFFKERLSVTAYLDARDGAEGEASRVLLGSWNLPMRAPMWTEIEKGGRRVRLELWGRLRIAEATTRKMGKLTEVALPVDLERLVLVDDATGAVISEHKAAEAAPAAKPAEKDSAVEDKDTVIER